MKCLTLFVHAAVAEACIDALRADPDLPGFTLTRCEGHSQRTESEAFVGARDRVVGYVPRARIEARARRPRRGGACPDAPT